jgi:hypothetical protein
LDVRADEHDHRAVGLPGETRAIEVAVVFCIVLIDRTASALVGRWGRGAAGEEFVGEALDSLRERGWFAYTTCS